MPTAALLNAAPVKAIVTVSPDASPLFVVAVTANPLGAFVFPSYIFVIGLYVNLLTSNCFAVIVTVLLPVTVVYPVFVT